MSTIIPIPTSRVGDLFVRQRLVGQVQNDQLELFKLQNQISTGKRLQLPSDDAPAALRAINLQRLLDRKGQIKTNIQASNSYLSAAESNLATVSDVLIKLRGDVLGVTGTLSNAADRQTLVQQIDQTLQTLVAAGNAKSQGRYLFAGSRSQDQPFDFTGAYVKYSGNEGVLRSYVDLERLFDTNLAGTDVFGGISSQIKGLALNPPLASDTLLSTINGGQGISRNAAITISINTGPSTETSVIDLSSAVTIGDVARLIEQGVPGDTEIVADVTGVGLRLSSTDGMISVTEVGEGRAARELGFPPGTAPNNLLVGSPLNPALLKTTQLESLLGTRSQGRIESAGGNNDIYITARQNGDNFDGVTVVTVDDVTAGSETAVYDQGTNTLTIHIEGGVSTASTVAAAITAEGTFTAVVDYHDATSSDDAGTNPVDVGSFGAITTGGTGEVFDSSSGLFLTNGANGVTLDTSGAKTVEDLLNLINGSGLGFAAEINATHTGINVRSRLSGADFMIGENGGTTATQLGIRTYTSDTALADFNRGVGVPIGDVQFDTSKLDNLNITVRDGTNFVVNLAGATTLLDVVNLVNTAPGNPGGVVASLTANRNGIEFADSSASPIGDLTVFTSDAAEYLGLVSPGEPQHSSTVTNEFGNDVIAGTNVIGNDLQIIASDNTEIWLDLAGAKTVRDVIDRINSDPANGGRITAELADVGNGIQLVDNAGGGSRLTVRATEGNLAAEYLGFVAAGQSESTLADVQLDALNRQVLTSADRHTLETDSVFNTLVRLQTALEDNNVEEISRSLDRLDADISMVSFARSEIGSRLQSLETIGSKLQDEDVQLRATLSQEMDVDLVEAISNMTARQYAFQASLQTAASLLRLSLLDFI